MYGPSGDLPPTLFVTVSTGMPRGVHRCMSFIYKSIQIYRLVMGILYHGDYTGRFTRLMDLIHPGDKTIVELCFGDIYIAEFCRNNDKKWIGYDLNPSFVQHARRQGFNAIQADV